MLILTDTSGSQGFVTVNAVRSETLIGEEASLLASCLRNEKKIASKNLDDAIIQPSLLVFHQKFVNCTAS
jgi:hypothetical protein